MVRAIEDLGYDSIWVGEHLLYRWPDRPPRGPWEAWTSMAAIAAVDVAGRVRAARRVHELPQPGAAGQAGRHDRRDQRRPLHPRPRRRLERDRVPGLRLPVRPPDRPLRGGVHDHPDAPARRRHRLRRPVLPGPRLRAAAARAATRRSAADDRLERPADAAHHAAARRCPGTCGSPTPATRRPACRRCASSSTTACRDVGRDPAEVERTVAVQVRLPGGTGRVQGDYATEPRLRRWRATPTHMADVLRAYAARGDRARPARDGPDRRARRSRPSRRCCAPRA